MKKTIKVKGHFRVVRGKRVYSKPYSYQRECREPKVVNGVSRSRTHNMEAAKQLRSLRLYTDRQNPDYSYMMAQYPDVEKLINSQEVIKTSALDDTLRKNIQHVHNVLYGN